MVAKGCEEHVSAYNMTEALKQQIEALRISLENAFTEYESDKELVRNPQAWVNYIDDAIKRAICILKLQKTHPELEDAFAKLETSCHRAGGRLPRYAERKGIKLPEERTF